MNEFFLYIIRSGVCLLLFYLAYILLLSKETFFSFNRKVLLGGMIACLFLPLIEINTNSPSLIQKPFVELDIFLTKGSVPFISAEMEKVGDEKAILSEEYSISYASFLCIIYTTGLIVGVLLSFRSFVSLIFFLRKGKKIKGANYTLILTTDSVIPFNWGNYIILTESEYQHLGEGILIHEIAHLKKRHSLDLLFMECLLVLHWFNPIVWFLRQELKNVHEYEADLEVINNGIDAIKYQLLLVKKAAGSRSYTFANSFNQSKLKTRITMMLKKQSNRQARWKLALFVPIAVFAMYAFARLEVNRQLRQLIPSEDTTINKGDKILSCDFFDQTFDAYYKQQFEESSLSRYEKFDRLKEKSRVLPVLINSENKFLVGKEIMTLDEFRKSIDAVILKNIQPENPLLLFFMYDKGTSEEYVESSYEILRTVIEKNSSDETPVLVYCSSSSRHLKSLGGQTLDDKVIWIRLFDKNDKEYLVDINEYDSFSVIKKKLNAFPVNLISRLEIKTNPATPMGVVTDIKSVLIEMHENVYGNASALKVEIKQ